jgi:tetratricopeptide (TPR) repeat protein
MTRPHRLLVGTALAGLLAASAALACEAHRPRPTGPARIVAELKGFGTLRHATPQPADGGAHAAPRPDERHVPLWPGMESRSFPADTAHPRAQRFVDQGVMLAFGFNHAEARRSFQEAQRLDPSCALCFWGEALVLGPNINAPMEPGANEAALAVLRRAAALAPQAGPRERALVEALEKRYSADPAADRAALDRAYADAMAAVSARFPDDLALATLAAEALMDLSPWDYWGPGGVEPKGRTEEILALLEGVLARDPDHPGAIHLYIHAVEASSRPQRAEPYADRLARQDLGAGHLVHMPSHIYYRVGRYRDSLEANRRAVAADEAFLKAAPASGIYAGGYYPHNIHFLMVSAQMAGDGATAIEAAGKLERAISDEVAAQYPWVQPI